MFAKIHERLAQTSRHLGAGLMKCLELRFGRPLDVLLQRVDQNRDLPLQVSGVRRGLRRQLIDGCFHKGHTTAMRQRELWGDTSNGIDI